MNSDVAKRVMAMIWDFVGSTRDDQTDPGPADDPGDPLDPAVRVPLRRMGGPGGGALAASVAEPVDDVLTLAVSRSRR